MRELELQPGTLPGYSAKLHLDCVNHAYAPAEVPTPLLALPAPIKAGRKAGSAVSLPGWCLVGWNPHTEAVSQQLLFCMDFLFQHLEILDVWTGTARPLKRCSFYLLTCKGPQNSLRIQFKTAQHANSKQHRDQSNHKDKLQLKESHVRITLALSPSVWLGLECVLLFSA